MFQEIIEQRNTGFENTQILCAWYNVSLKCLHVAATFRLRFFIDFTRAKACGYHTWKYQFFNETIYEKLTLSGFKTLTGLTHEFRASDFVFSGSFGLCACYQ